MQSRSYDDYAALYYLLLSKWEKGQLQVPSAAPQIPYPRLSQSGFLPVISINTSELTPSAPIPKNLWHHIPTTEGERLDDYPNDPTLARYLKLGRRHTLGAAQNHMLVPSSDLGRLREASEASSHTSNDTTTGSVSNPAPLGKEPQRGVHESGHKVEGLYESTTTNTPSTPTRPFLQPPLRSRVGRRASDGGPYAAAFRLYLEKRTPHLAQINSQSSLQDSVNLSSTSSVKQLLLDKRAQEGYLVQQQMQPQEWLQYPNAVSSYYITIC